MSLGDYAHPLFAAVALGFWFYAGSLGLRSRVAWPRERAELLRRHRSVAPLADAGVALAFASGGLAVSLGRPDLELGSTVHFRLGCTLVVLAATLALSSRWMHLPWVRLLHPWCGAAALLCAAAQVFFGLQITR